jgi:hypothetical protein
MNNPDQLASDQVFITVKQALSELSSLEFEEISIDDHLEENLFLDIERHIPLLVTNLNHELEIEIEPETIAEFIGEAKEDNAKATVAELLSMIKEEVEFS